MALRALVGKLRGGAQEAASRAFSRTCEHCGKTSSRIAGSLGQKNGAIEDEFSVRFKKFRRKEYIKRATAAFTTIYLSCLLLGAPIAYLEDEENFPRQK